MADRDLLHKAAPLVVPEDKGTGKKGLPAQSTDKLGLKTRGRDIGGSGDAVALKKVGDSEGPAAAPAPAAKETVQQARGPAYKSAYFTKDIESTAQVNLRSRPMQALRGSEGASDLKRVVLPPSGSVEVPNPDQIRAASELMGLSGHPLDLGSLLSRQGNWAKQKGVTVEMIEARMAQLRSMVNDRVQALQRMGRLTSDRLARSVTLAQAATMGGQALDQVQDVASEGGELVRNTSEQAEGMHTRLAKVLGLK